MAVKLDIRGSRYRQGGAGTVYDRRGYVDGLTASTATAKIAEALAHPDVPKIGDTISELPGIFCSDIAVEQVSSGTASGVKWALMSFTYRPADFVSLPPDDNGPGLLTVGATTEQVTTYKDREGNQIFVEHQGLKQGVGVSIKVANPVFEFSRREETNPEARASAHVGNVNSVFSNGHAARTLFLAELLGTSSDGGESFDSRYRFEKRKDTHDPTVVYVDPDTGDPPEGLVDGEGIKDVEVYDESDFNLLNINF